jgi:DNA-directed RNA polymerase specialized sigma subunit
MIRTDAEYAQARSRLLDERKRLAEHEASMTEAGLDPAQLKRAMDPLRSFTLQLEEEVETYERMQRGSFDPITNLAGLGQLLVGARIFAGISQRELAKRLEVHESQVSRDERNEYRGITVDRATRILEAIGAVELYSVMRPKFS